MVQLLVEVQQRLGITLRAVPVPPRLQPRPELQVVVYLPVEDDVDAAILVRHRLVPGSRQVHDAETPVPQRHPPVRGKPRTGIVRPAVRERVPHAAQHGRLFAGLPAVGYYAADSAHRAGRPGVLPGQSVMAAFGPNGSKQAPSGKNRSIFSGPV